ESMERDDASRPHSGSLPTLGLLLNVASVVDRQRRSRVFYSFIARWLVQSRFREDRSKANERKFARGVFLTTGIYGLLGLTQEGGCFGRNTAGPRYRA